MKRLFTKCVALLLVIISLAAIVTMPASAATSDSDVDCSGTASGGVTVEFYVKTGKTKKSRQIDLTMDTGWISAKSSAKSSGVISKVATVYGAYEIKIDRWDSKTKKWVKEDSYDAYNDSSDTITLDKKNTYYKIRVYSWRVSTVFTSYWNKNVNTQSLPRKFKKKFPGDAASDYNNVCWSQLPSCIATPRKGCTLYLTSPVE